MTGLKFKVKALIQRLTLKTILKHTFISILFITVLLFSVDAYVTHKAKPYLYNDINKIPFNKVGLLPGTSKKLKNGKENLYYTYRINAAVELYKAHKIKYILVSGDNSTKYYNEPASIKNDLIKQGIPENRIFLDYAGFRTLDSVVRSKAIFGQNKITVISQPFHNERAIFIAKAKGIDAIGFNAKTVNTHYGIKTKIREKFARVKMMFDLFFDVSPKFYGKKIKIQ